MNDQPPAANICIWRRRYEDGLFKWVISCQNMVVLRQDRDDQSRSCGYCGKRVKHWAARND